MTAKRAGNGLSPGLSTKTNRQIPRMRQIRQWPHNWPVTRDASPGMLPDIQDTHSTCVIRATSASAKPFLQRRQSLLQNQELGVGLPVGRSGPPCPAGLNRP